MAKQKKTTTLKVELPLTSEHQEPKVEEVISPPQETKNSRCCGECQHYQKLEEANGFCRRFPPMINSLVLTSKGPYGIFPITLSTNLCGEFSPLTATAEHSLPAVVS